MFAPARGRMRRLCNVGGRGRDMNQDEQSWDSRSTAGPFQRQSGTTDWRGDGQQQHHFLCLDGNTVERAVLERT